MKEIKFRQPTKCPVTKIKTWHYWGYITTKHGTHFESPLGKVEWEDRISYQYTGLKDKNGKEIWEGDILNYRGQPVIIEYINDMFHCKSTKYPNLSPGNYRLDTLRRECEVIGNIYETPELLNSNTP